MMQTCETTRQRLCRASKAWSAARLLGLTLTFQSAGVELKHTAGPECEIWTKSPANVGVC